MKLVAGELFEHERDVVDAHLDACALCSTVCAELVRQQRLPGAPIGDQLFASAIPVRIGGELDRDGPVVIELGHDLELDREVVVVSLASADPVAVARFADEVRTAAGLEHAGIPAVMRSGTLDDGRVAYTLRRMSGRRLDELLRSAKRGERRVLVPVIARAVGAVAYAHEQGIAHGSLDGAAIVVGQHGEVVVERWGAWRRHRDARDAGPDPREDLRSLGELLEAALGTGRRPPELATIISLSGNGYRSAGELAADLARFLDG